MPLLESFLASMHTRGVRIVLPLVPVLTVCTMLLQLYLRGSSLARIERTPIRPVFPSASRSDFGFSDSYVAEYVRPWRTARPGTYFSLTKHLILDPQDWKEEDENPNRSKSQERKSSAEESKARRGADKEHAIVAFGFAWRGKVGKGKDSVVWRHHTVSAPHEEVSFRWRKHNGAGFGDQEIEDKKLGIKLRVRFLAGKSAVTGREAKTTGQGVPKVGNGFQVMVDVEAVGGTSSASQETKLDLFFYWHDANEMFSVSEGSMNQPATGSLGPLLSVEGKKRGPRGSSSFRVYSEGANGAARTGQEFVSCATMASTNALRSGTGVPEWWDFERMWKSECGKKKGANKAAEGSWVAVKLPARPVSRFLVIGGGEGGVKLEGQDAGLRTSPDEPTRAKDLLADFADAAESASKDFSRKVRARFAPDTATVDGKIVESAVSSLLGGIGTFHGTLLVKDPAKEPARSRSERTFTLRTGTPARAMFPRGFLWDEGFHLLVTLEWSEELFYEIVLDWFGLQDPTTGWIPREVPLGLESESFVPDRFLGQERGVMNPPTLLLGILNLLGKYKLRSKTAALEEDNGVEIKLGGAAENKRRHVSQFNMFLTAALPHLAKWLEQWRLTQENMKYEPVAPPESLSDVFHILTTTNPLDLVRDTKLMAKTFSIDKNTCFRWRDRYDEKHVLSSGLDDYPRGLFVNEAEECHVDNHVWFMLLVHGMKEVCEYMQQHTRPSAWWAATAPEHALAQIKSYCSDTELDFGLMLEQLRAGLDHIYSVKGRRGVDLGMGADKDAKTARAAKYTFYADYVGAQPITKKGKTITVAPWEDSHGQCGGKKECPVGQCCSPSGWCGTSPEYCNCPQCVKYDTPLREREAYATTERRHSPHFGYVNLLPFALAGATGIAMGGAAPADGGGDGGTAFPTKKFFDELVTDYGVRSLSKKDALSGKGENYWRGKIWANLNLLLLTGRGSTYFGEPEAKPTFADAVGLSSGERKKLHKAKVGFLHNVEKNFREKGNFFENFDPITGAGTGAIPFTGWTAVAYVLLAGETQASKGKPVTKSAQQQPQVEAMADESGRIAAAGAGSEL